MFFPDLSKYSFCNKDEGSSTLNVGWLDISKEYQTGILPIETRDILREICKTPVNLTRGFHYCQFCNPKTDDVALGNGEIRVVGKEGIIYAAPVLIGHYVEVHSYLPPQCFVSAINDSQKAILDDEKRHLQ